MKNSFIVIMKKHMVAIILTIAFWLFAEIFLIVPIATTIVDSKATNVFDFSYFFENIMVNIVKVSGLGKVFKEGYRGTFVTCTIIFTVFCAICVGIGLFKGRKKGQYDKIEHGSSDWSTGGEQYRVLDKNSGLILAEDNYLPLDKLGNTNVLIVGGSGSGKSSAYTVPNAHQCLGSYIFTDPKGEIYDITAGYLQSKGYQIKLLNLVNPSSSDSYNPIQHVKSELDVDVIANTIVKGQQSEQGGGQDPFWDNMSELLLKALIYYLISAVPPEEQNLASCAELVRAANTNGNTNLLSELFNKLPYDHPARMNYKSVEISSEKTYSSILSSLQSKLGKFDSKEIASVTSTNTINFDEIAEKKTALYVVSSDTHTAYDFLLTIFFSQMIQQLYDYADKHGGKLPNRAFFILDEFSNIGQIPDFDKKISTSRSRGISFSVILQNLDQLKALYEKSYETIIGNCDTHVFLGSNSYATVEYFSKELGEKTISHYSKSVNRDNYNDRKGYSESDQIMGRALMTPDELRRLDSNECIIFEKGLKPIRAKKYFWFRKPRITRDLNSNRIDHNNHNAGERGEWRKYNPYNPNTNTVANEKEQNIKIESLDDLFEDNNAIEEKKTNETRPPAVETIPKSKNNGIGLTNQIRNPISNPNINRNINANLNKNININGSSNLNKNINTNGNTNLNKNMNINGNTNLNKNINTNGNTNLNKNMNINGNTNLNINKNMNGNSNINTNTYQNTTNKQPNNDEDDDIDIQKELEAKFDELFGSTED